MDSTRFRECLAAIGWSPRDLAAYLKVNETAPRKWAMGKTRIPENLAAWLELVAAGPEGWFKPREGAPPPEA